MVTVEKLAYIYINSALLDTFDKNDYYDDLRDESDEETIVI